MIVKPTDTIAKSKPVGHGGQATKFGSHILHKAPPFIYSYTNKINSMINVITDAIIIFFFQFIKNKISCVYLNISIILI